jgi:uncharacterized protein
MIRKLNDPHPLQDEMRHFIANPQFPCVGAKSAMARGKLTSVVARAITSAWDDLAVHRALMTFAGEYRRDPALFQSFAVIFEGPRTLDEPHFEQHLWRRVQSLSDKDQWLGQPYNDRVSPDPSNPHFALSFAGEAFFVVGLHPRASRKARRFHVLPPISKAGDHIRFKARVDLIIGLTACSAALSNGGSFKPVDWHIDD